MRAFMIEGAITILIGLAIGYYIGSRKVKEVEGQLKVAREIEKERDREPLNFYDN